jgi:hypothetical protein
MRKLFPGYYTPKKEEFAIMWKNGLFVFDTNVLLDLYRYSENTVNSLLEVMESVNERIWLPYQVSKEYHKNLNTVISDQVKKYESSIKTLIDFKKQIDEKRSHPFLSEELTTEIENFCEKLSKVLDIKMKTVKHLILNNPIKEKVADLTEGKIGSQFSQEDLDKIYADGEIRYKKKVPPGFGDLTKPIPDRYGDLIFWKEILRKNSEIDLPIILITGDKKEDWYLKELGLTIGPRPELIEEFKNVKDNLFYIYPTDTFLKYSKEYLEATIDDEAIREVGDYIKDNSKNILIIPDFENESFSQDENLPIESNEDSNDENFPIIMGEIDTLAPDDENESL